ncbi:hypothetical protein [Mycolicibacterium monacense]|uniref:Secreted protein n=4 Tax=Mycobacteriaceae TaxID=1762 RepID=A0AAD1J067_MYCMB|nr:hypothetical protein [Mycolicibacterium monacense]MDA4102478.1 hypothetical protein [Mycolicibacterium monacense DSM 44395]OBB68249.1 hypothetical protein A6B34_20080 [Mycolicibacterium monacense]OBF55838.1 hypothetical protein A5778_08400 [Mycolicibacterium monacense]ORB17903.1 hypothetical protein BST34_17735 [Mycolicibacterium monacense DSM 44395]QHP88663.1 hypothetical protein EWR22_26760 [Mycolicibacterium monacense DSM 44395]
MFKSTSSKLSGVNYAAALLGAFAVFALAPATAAALPPGNTTGNTGCHYTDKDGYDIPIDDGQSVVVDGKTVTCSGGTITVSQANTGGVRPQRIPNLQVFEAQKPVLAQAR